MYAKFPFCHNLMLLCLLKIVRSDGLQLARYLPGLDRRAILTLFRTSPRSQVHTLRTLIVQHIRPEPRLDVTLDASTK